MALLVRCIVTHRNGRTCVCKQSTYTKVFLVVTSVCKVVLIVQFYLTLMSIEYQLSSGRLIWFIQLVWIMLCFVVYIWVYEEHHLLIRCWTTNSNNWARSPNTRLYVKTNQTFILVIICLRWQFKEKSSTSLLFSFIFVGSVVILILVQFVTNNTIVDPSFNITMQRIV